MNEFAWRRQLRDLRVPLSPPDDLWTSIEARLDHAPLSTVPLPSQNVAPSSINRRRWANSASSVALVLIGVCVAWHQHLIKRTTTTVASVQSTRPWKPIDSHYMGAAIELESAQRELRQALQVAPDSVALQRLLQRTEQQQMQLRAREQQTG